jgi:hypothetical protein
MTRPCFISSPPLPKEKKMKEMNLATRGEKKKKKGEEEISRKNKN